MTHPYIPQPGGPGAYEQQVAARDRAQAAEILQLKAERTRLEDDLGRARQRCALLEAGASEREALLTEARDLLEPWGGHGDAWPSIGPAISMLIERLNDALQRAERAEAGVSRVRAQCERWRFTPDRKRAAEEMLRELDRAGDHFAADRNAIKDLPAEAGNAEDCPQCRDRRDLPYPFLCPGHPVEARP